MKCAGLLSRFAAVWIVAPIVFGASVLQSAAAAEDEPIAVVRRPVPRWVEPVPLEFESVAPVGGVQVLLWETQTSISAEGVVRFVHGALRPVAAAGLGQASAIPIAFDPTYQRYAWHRLRIHRAGRTIDALSQADMQRATGDEDGDEVLHGVSRVTAFVRDVRVGDVIEYAYSVEGDQPTLGGRFTGRLDLAKPYAVGHIRHRVLWPRRRALQIRAHGSSAEPQRTTEGDRDVYRWEVRGAAAVEEEPDAPRSFDARPWIQLSEFASWADVVQWGLPLYAAAGRVEPEVEALARTLRGAGSQSEIAERAARFVQDEVRYLGFEFGEGGFRPREPALVIARRFGDCKDKSVLLVALLHALGIQAVPVLVSTSDRAAVQSRLPSPADFDHMIVRAEIDGGPVWIDSTASYERGPLLTRSAPPFAVALPIAQGVVAPESIVAGVVPSDPDTHVQESFEINADAQGRTLLRVTTRLRRSAANQRRSGLAASTVEDEQRLYLEFYGNLYGALHVAEPLQIRDDEQRNEIEIVESYAFDEPWVKDAEFSFWSVPGRRVRSVRGSARRAPIALAYPTHILHEIEVQLPSRFSISDENEDAEGPGIWSNYQAHYAGRKLRLRKEYRTLAPVVGAADLPAFERARDRIESSARYVLIGGMRGGMRARPDPPLWPVLIGLGSIPAFFLVLNRRALRAQLHRWRAARARRPGDSVEQPAAVASLEEIEPLVKRLSCTCRRRARLEITTVASPVFYMGRELWVQATRCPVCARRLTLYFRLDPTAAHRADGAGWAGRAVHACVQTVRAWTRPRLRLTGDSRPDKKDP